MEPVLLVVILALVVLASAAGVAVRRRRRQPVELEPPPARSAPPVVPPTAPPPEIDVPQAPAGTAEAPPADVHAEAAEAPPAEVEVPDALVEQVEEALAEAAPPVAPPVKPRFRDRLSKARTLLASYVGSVLSRAAIDEETWEELEEALVRADVGVALTGEVLDGLRRRVKAEAITRPDELLEALKGDLKALLAADDRSLAFEPGLPNVWLVVGVNGVGKTTTIGKLAKRESADGKRVVLAAGDTFRAAAGEQLELWANRAGADIVRAAEGADPGSVVFDAVERAAARSADLVLADTAGRLHTKVNLMEELKKVRRVAERPPGRCTEVLLVLDATTGQNGLVQAKEFTGAVQVTGVVLTKLDGTAKGGIAIAVQKELGIPIKLVGLGESIDDLVEFDPDEFVEALFDE